MERRIVGRRRHPLLSAHQPPDLIFADIEHGSLVEIERSLPPAGLFRINRTEIVALAAIDQLRPDGDRIALAVKGLAGPCVISGHRAAAFRKWVGMT